VLSKSAASDLTARLLADYQTVASCDLAEFKVLYTCSWTVWRRSCTWVSRERRWLTAWGIVEGG
jgi:hypothetical protein